MTSINRFLKHSALVGQLMLAIAAVSTTSATAGIINFDSLDTSTSQVTGSAINDYLDGFGVTVANETPGTFLRVMTPLVQGDADVVLATTPNYMAQWWNGINGTSFDLMFDKPLESLYVSIPQINSGTSVPAWSLTALDANANVLTTGYGQAGLSGASAQRTFEFLNATNPGLQGIRVFTNVFGVAGMGGIPIDDLVFTQNNAVPEPTSLAIFGIGAFGLAAVRRRKQQRSA